MKLPWRYEFAETGGYDCMYSAFHVLNVEGEEIATVDTGDWTNHCGRLECPDGVDDWDWQHMRHPEIEAVAQAIVEAVNGYEDLKFRMDGLEK